MRIAVVSIESVVPVSRSRGMGTAQSDGVAPTQALWSVPSLSFPRFQAQRSARISRNNGKASPLMQVAIVCASACEPTTAAYRAQRP